MPVDSPTKESTIDDLHENESDGKTRQEAENDTGGSEVSGLGHDGTKNLATGRTGGAEDTDFASAFDAEGGEREGDAEGSDGDGQGA